jgi:nucleotide-binding universal stress UspA family protein
VSELDDHLNVDGNSDGGHRPQPAPPRIAGLRRVASPVCPVGKDGLIIKQIVVGTDGSEQATGALRWAVEEAEVHAATVEAVLAWSLLDQYHPDHSDRFDPAYGEEAAHVALAAWITDTLGADANVAPRVVNDLPARALLEAGDAADLIVLGARGTGGFEGLLLGSVSERVAQLADRPVAVVRRPAPVRDGRVVVGIDGSARALDALRWAAAEARTRDADLDVVHAWSPRKMTAPSTRRVLSELHRAEDAGRAVLGAAVADPALAGVRVNPLLTDDSPARALLERAADAGLLVVGTRGLGRVSGALLGSVSRQLLHHAPSIVVVI